MIEQNLDPMCHPINSTCRICQNSIGNTAYRTREMMYGLRDEFDYFQCSVCNCLQIAEFPLNMSRFYGDSYYSFNAYDGKKFKGPLGSIKRVLYTKMITGRPMVKRLVGLFTGPNDYGIFDGMDVSSDTRILDVGCGNGRSFLYPLAEIDFKHVQGCDPYLKEPIVYRNGLRINNTSIHNMCEAFDTITYHHSFEHIEDPLENLEKAFSLLSEGGVCIVRIPTVSSFAWEHYRTDWAQLDAPRHFFLHSIESMRLLAKKSGFELTNVVYDSTHFQFSGSEKYRNDTPLSAPRIKGIFKFVERKLKKFQYTRMAERLNREKKGDQACFFLKKTTASIYP